MPLNMIKRTLAVLLVPVLLPRWAAADEDDKALTSTVNIQGGQLVGEKQEIEIYDYHTGTYQTVDVYRKPDKTQKQIPDSTQTRPSVQQPR